MRGWLGWDDMWWVQAVRDCPSFQMLICAQLVSVLITFWLTGHFGAGVLFERNS
jgi:hypothetical protein